MDLPREQRAGPRLITVQGKLVLISASLRRTLADPAAFSIALPASSSEAYARAVASTTARVWPP